MFVISQAAATVTLSNLTQDFNGTPLTPTVTTVPPGLSFSWTGAPDTNPGNYPVTATVTDPNYTGSANGSFIISDNIDLSALSLNGVNYGSGTAALPIWTGSMLQLTNSTTETASAWLKTAIPVSSAFTTTFQFQISPASSGPNSIGDGFAFVIQGAPTGNMTLGSTGLGQYIGYAGIPNSIAIEFDTYYNQDYGDPMTTGISDAHVGIQSLGTFPNTSDHETQGANLGGPTLYNFADGNQHTATITYDGTTLSVFLDQSTNPNAIVTAVVNLNTLLGLNAGPAYVGFTAATGGAQEADILGSTWTWN
jgi:hypothetical protein